MVDSEYSTKDYKSPKISIGKILKNPDMLKFAPKSPKLPTKLPYITKYVHDRCKTQQMCVKAILENGGTLESVPDCYKNQQMCDKTVDNYPHELKFVSDSYMTQKKCDKAVNTHFSIIQFLPECCRTQKMCNKAVNRCFLYLILFPIGIKLKK